MSNDLPERLRALEERRAAMASELETIETQLTHLREKQLRLVNNPAQRLAFEMMRLASFNGFDGNAVADALLANPSLWAAALMPTSGYTVRDLPEGCWHADTLIITCDSAQCSALTELASTFRADEVEWLKGEEAREYAGRGALDRKLSVLRLWWD